MSVRFYVRTAQGQVATVRRRIADLGYDLLLDERADVEAIAVAFLDCQLIPLRDLSERTAFAYLERAYGIDTSMGVPPDPAPLAGGLFVTESGSHRWVFVEESEAAPRQRFTIAHEIGHLILHAEPDLERARAIGPSLFEQERAPSTLRAFGRCSTAAVGAEERDPEASTSRASRATGTAHTTQLSQADLREIHANHFAAELLMPYEAVRRLIASAAGPTGVRTPADVARLTGLLAERFDVSTEAAWKRLTKDLGIAAGGSAGGSDLFR